MKISSDLELIPLSDEALEWLQTKTGIENPVDFFQKMQNYGWMLSGSMALALLYINQGQTQEMFEPGDADFFPCPIAARNLYSTNERNENFVSFLGENGFYPLKVCDHWALEAQKTQIKEVQRQVKGLPWEVAAPAKTVSRLVWAKNTVKLQIMLKSLDNSVLPWEDFDFTVLRISVICDQDDRFKLLFDRRVLEDFQNKELIWNQKPYLLIKAARRAKKYIDRGFHMKPAEINRWENWVSQSSKKLLWLEEAESRGVTPGSKWEQIVSSPLSKTNESEEPNYEEMDLNRDFFVDQNKIFQASREKVQDFQTLNQLVM